MNSAIVSKTNGGLKLELSWLALSLLFILVCTLLNGFYDSASLEYGASTFWECTFLGEPADLHGDLVKSAISLAPSAPPDVWEWSPHYQNFYYHNAYGKMEDVAQGRVTLFGLPPLTLMIMTGIMHAILATGPDFVTTTFYIAAFILLGVACWTFIANFWERFLAFFVLALGYPFLLTLTRANIGAIIVGFALIFFIYLTCHQRHLVIACICLAIACNIRPNAILLAPLFLCFGMRKSIIASAVFLVLATALAAFSYVSAVSVYPGYSTDVFLKALGNYNHLYVIGSFGNGNNNSAYGAFKTLYGYWVGFLTEDLLMNANWVILSISLVAIVFLTYRFWRGRLPAYYFAFALTCIYILATTIFSTYHLLVLYAFLLLAGGKAAREGAFPTLLIFMSALVLIPKDYYFIYPNVSCEVFLNPIILLACLTWILFMKFSPTDALPATEKVVVRGGKDKRRSK